VLVVDASVLAPVVADGGSDGAAYRSRLRGERIAAPDLLRVEVVSVIRRQLRVGLLDVDQAERALDDLLDLPVAVYPTVALLRRGWELRDNVSAYDACYIALAESLDSTLLTADVRLARAPGVDCTIELI
jgi:predicted nucleic acid-binding protein